MSTSPKPSAFVTTFTSHQGLGFLSGQLPRKDGELMYRGKAGAEVDLESARRRGAAVRRGLHSGARS
jgi:hypothetical protein